MDNTEQNLIFQQYKLYSEQKENFISRSFGVNRFYISLCVFLLIAVQLTKGLVFAYTIPLSVFLAIIGLSATILWWMNMDAYNMLIKIKFSRVLEEIEKQLPIQPYAEEYHGIQEFRENKNMFLFSDMQKIFAVIVFLMFFIAVLEGLIPVIVGSVI